MITRRPLFNLRNRTLLAAFLFLIFAGALAWSYRPLESSAAAVPVWQVSSAETDPEPAKGELRRAVLDWPASVRVGDSRRANLTLEVVVPAVQPSLEGRPSARPTEPPPLVVIPDLYERYDVRAEARLDLAGVELRPEGTILQPLRPGEPVEFTWSISPRAVGTTQGTLWLYLNLRPKKGGENQQMTLLARPVELRAVNVWGLPAGVVRWGSAVGMLISLLFAAPFTERLLLMIWKRVRRSQTAS